MTSDKKPKIPLEEWLKTKEAYNILYKALSEAKKQSDKRVKALNIDLIKLLKRITL